MSDLLDLAGEVVVQTFTPHAMPIQFGRQAEVDGFLAEEIKSREAHQYPPFRHLIVYPAAMRDAERQWRAITGDREPARS